MTNGELLLNIAHSTMGAGCLGMHSAIVWQLAEMKRPPQRTGTAAKIGSESEGWRYRWT